MLNVDGGIERVVAEILKRPFYTDVEQPRPVLTAEYQLIKLALLYILDSATTAWNMAAQAVQPLPGTWLQSLCSHCLPVQPLSRAPALTIHNVITAISVCCGRHAISSHAWHADAQT